MKSMMKKLEKKTLSSLLPFTSRVFIPLTHGGRYLEHHHCQDPGPSRGDLHDADTQRNPPDARTHALTRSLIPTSGFYQEDEKNEKKREKKKVSTNHVPDRRPASAMPSRATL